MYPLKRSRGGRRANIVIHRMKTSLPRYWQVLPSSLSDQTSGGAVCAWMRADESGSGAPASAGAAKLTRGQLNLRSHPPPCPLLPNVPAALRQEHILTGVRQEELVRELATAVAVDLLGCSTNAKESSPEFLSRVFLTRDDLKLHPPRDVHARTKRLEYLSL